MCVLHNNSSSVMAAFDIVAPSGAGLAELMGARRARIWDLSSHLHCSIVGTCLTAGELRRLFRRLGDPDADSASDHDLHGRGVRAASRPEEGGKLLNKTLDKRHETAIRRFAKAENSGELRALWTKALDQGEIAGPYWALLTHPATDAAVARDVFGDVHMLSHQVGAAARLDIARLRRLEADLVERDDRLASLQERLDAAIAERVALQEAVRRLESSAALHKASPPICSPDEGEVAALRLRLSEMSAHAATLAERLETSENLRARADTRARESADGVSDLRRELSALEAAWTPDQAALEAPPDAETLLGVRILYVGGRRKLTGQLDSFVAARGGILMAHDGGVEDSLALLPGLVSQADAVYFPVDCISHAAAERVKTLCGRLAKPWAPLRSASLASFARVLRERDGARRAPLAAE